MKKILVIDNYDSFVHNAVQLLRESSEPVNITIQLNDRIDFEKFGDYDGVLLSPGPGIPEEAGDLMAANRSAPDRRTLPFVDRRSGLDARRADCKFAR